LTATRQNPLILIVDDDATTNRMIREILSRSGFDTITAFDVAGALREIELRQPDLILLDISLPDGNGFEVCKHLQSKPGAAQTPVLFISSHDDVTTKVQGFEAGGVDYITKPLAGAEIIARVSTHLRLKHAYQRLEELQAERIQRLAVAQGAIMPVPEDLPEARFSISLQQVNQAGGDFYDVISVGPQQYDYIVADASGHDLAASFWTASLKTLLTEYATPLNTPREILQSVNNTLCRILPAEVFFTISYARLNRKTGRLILASAGHPPVCVLPKENNEVRLLRLDSDIVGAFADAGFESTEVVLRPGDRFVIYSDGLIENNQSCEAGLERLQKYLISHKSASLQNLVRDTVRDMIAGAEPHDDILLLGVEV
jgi:sigma-B regulation protein RsbU (phosphoserine phosphatase)